MSGSTHVLDKTFKLIKSEEDYEAIVAFAVEHLDVFERLEEVFANAPATVKDGLHLLAKAVFLTVDALTTSLAFKEPKAKRRFGNGHRVTFSINARQPGEKGLLAVGPAFAVGLFRMQQAVQAADVIYTLGFDASPGLNTALEDYAAQIRSALYWLAR